MNQAGKGTLAEQLHACFVMHCNCATIIRYHARSTQFVSQCFDHFGRQFALG